MNGQKPWFQLPPAAGRLASAGLEIAASVVGGCGLGYLIDRGFGTSPWGLLICALIGIVGGLYNLVRKEVRRTLQQSQRPSDTGPARKAEDDAEGES